MQECVQRGCRTEGTLPGGFKVRRAPRRCATALTANPEAALRDPLQVLDWVNLYALAVNEENAAGGRVVTAPTNGAAGIVPAVLHYYTRFVPGATDARRDRLPAHRRGHRHPLQGERQHQRRRGRLPGRGRRGLQHGRRRAVRGDGRHARAGGERRRDRHGAPPGPDLRPGRRAGADPCIERNAIASVKAINAARMALRGDGTHFVSLDKVIKTMRDTGADMMTKYKETARGGLAVNIVEC
jgi:L-serine dehydratase